MAGDARREFSRSEYRRVVAWRRRLEREGPFLREQIERSPTGGIIVDVGCGSGEHARFHASEGHRVVGVDPSRDALRTAAESLPGRWIRADFQALPLEGRTARGILCLGNTLVILGNDEAILNALREAYRVLLPGGFLLVQILNYHRLRSEGARHLPLNFRTREDASGTELVYLRLLDFHDALHVDFHVVTLERRSGEDAVVVRGAVRRRLRSLEHDALEDALRRAGFSGVLLLGDYAGAAFSPAASPDVIALARRPLHPSGT